MQNQPHNTEIILTEIKQFIIYFSYLMDRVIQSNQDEQQMSKEELQTIDNIKYQINDFYNHFQMNQNRSVVPLIRLCVKNIILNETYPTNLLRVTIKMLIKVFEHGNPDVHFYDQKSSQLFNPEEALASLMELQFDDHSYTIDLQEQLWLNIQTLILEIMAKITTNKDCCFKIIGFFLKFLNQRGFTCDQRQGQTIHFTEEVKKNTLKLLNLLYVKGYQGQAFKTTLFEMVMTAIKVYNQPIELDEQKQPKMSQLDKKKINEKQIKIICFGLKSTHDLLEAQKDSMKDFIPENINTLVHMTCLACEHQDLIVKTQGQMLFQFVMTHIMKHKLALREQFEILYVKCALKPIINRIKTLNEAQLKDNNAKDAAQQSTEPAKVEEQLSDQEDIEEDQVNQPIGDPLLHASSYGEKREENKESQGQMVVQQIKDFNSDLEFELCYNFLVEVILQFSPEDLGLLFLSYDCQHFSESIITKSLKLIIQYGKHEQKKFTRIFERISHGLAQLPANEKLEEQIVHMTHQRIKYMLDTKSQQKTLARQCNIKPKLFLNKCQELYGMVDTEAPWDIASKILLFSREIIVEHVTEILGGKEDRNKAIYGCYLDKQDFRDNSLEKSFRRVMQTFRLAGVESQCVTRVLEGFGQKFFQYDASKSFIDHEEAYEMTFLMIVLQTTEHNPNIKQKLRYKDFEGTCKDNCPKSWDTLPADYVKVMYENIQAEEIMSPLTRKWYESEFNQADLTFCQIKLSSFQEERQLTSNEFINLADLTSSQLFNFNNRFDSVKPEDQSVLVFGALRSLVTMLTKEFIKTSELQNPRDKLVLRNLMKTNQTLLNYGFTDKLIRGLAKIDNNSENVLKEIINNFDKGAQNTVTLIPQLVIRNSSMSELGKIDRKQLLEICQASERYFRKKLADSQTEIKRKIMTLEGKTPSEIDEEIKRKKQDSISSAMNNATIQPDNENQSSYSFVNIVFNYFNDSQQDGVSGENMELIQKLQQRAEKLKNDQMEHMKQMNKMFADLVNIGQDSEESKSNKKEEESFGSYLQTEMLSILQKILAVFKDNLHQIVQSKDGLYCLLFINNCIHVLNQQDYHVDNKKECLDLIWQEMHAIMSKLSNTKRKVATLGKSSSQRQLEVDGFSSDQRENEDENLSQLETDRSEDLSQGKSSSEQSSSLNQEMKQVQTFSEGSKVHVSYTAQNTKNYERRVFQSLCKHLILEGYFDINKFMIENISGISQPNADRESVEKCLNDEDIKKDLNEAIREVQRVYKSIVNGPQNKNEDDSDVQEDEQLTQSRMFDDLHAIICMNRLLQIEFKFIQNDHELKLLPISQYDKIYKLLRNLIINSCSSVDDTQIEVYVQNSDAFIDVITNCLKYITQQMMSHEQKLVPYHLINLIVQLISKISSKSQAINIAEPIPQFLSIFERIFKIMSVQNQFELWMEIMKQYQQIVILNKDMVTRNHEGTFNHVMMQYKNQVMTISMEIFGEVGNKQFDLNIQKMFEDLFYQVTFQKMAAKIEAKNPSKEVLQKLRVFAKIHLDQTTDVLIQMLHQIYTYNLDDEQLQQLFVSLWFPYLRTQLQFVEQMNELAPSVKENFIRILEFLMNENILVETQPKIWNESWSVVSSFFPNVKAQMLQD